MIFLTLCSPLSNGELVSSSAEALISETLAHAGNDK